MSFPRRARSSHRRTSQDTYPHPEHVLQNGAVPGTHSGYMSLCVKWHVPEDADLVLVRAPDAPQ